MRKELCLFEAFISQKHFGGWNMLMKLTGKDLDYNSKYWTTEALLNQISCSEESIEHSAKFLTYNVLPLEMIMIVDESGRKTVLKLPEKKPLLEYFKSEKPIGLEFLDGEPDPIALITNTKGNNVKDGIFKFHDPVWRINSFSKDYPDFKIRLGGFFLDKKGEKGKDTDGNKCTAEAAGLGISDKQWAPHKLGKKSYGVRVGNDHQCEGGGQVIGKCIIYGK